MTLTASIAADLRRRLAAPGAAVDLRLTPLAESYHVSTQPVRLALQQLQREGRLVQETSGTFRAKPGRRPRGAGRRPAVSAPPPPPDSAATDLHRRVAQMVVEKSLRGDTAFLREATTARRFGVSRSLAREVLHRLRGEGLVEHVARRGWRVRPFSRDDLADFLEVREVLEVRALTLAWSRLDPVDLQAFLDGNLDPRRGQDNRLHNYWIERSRNRYIQAFFAQHAPFFRALFDWEEHDTAASRQSRAQHVAILRAILAGDRPAAIAALVTHIHDNHPVLGRARPPSRP